MIRVYGIRQCDACRKTIKWFQQQDLPHEFIDLRENPVGAERIGAWLTALGSDTLLNKRSTTWRQLGEAERSREPVELLLAHPTLIKRPLVDRDGELTVGFQPGAWAES